MGKKVKGSSRRDKTEVVFREQKDEQVDSSSRNFVYDEIDDYYENEEQVGLQKLGKLMKRPKFQQDDEILGVASSSEDEVHVQKPSKRKKKKKVDLVPQKADMEDMASDVEEQNDDQLDTRAWGKNKSTYYSRDKIDSHQLNSDEEQLDAAVLEEQEALNLQKRMLEDLEESDFGLGYLLPRKGVATTETLTDQEQQHVLTDLSTLSSREQLELLKKESPELLELIEDFKNQLQEARRLSPLIALQHKIPSTPGLTFVQIKFQLIMNYCTNVSYYLLLKARKQSGLSSHPVIKRLVQFRGLLQQLSPIEKKCRKSLESILSKLNAGQEILWEEKAEKPVVANAKPKKLLSILKPKDVQEPTAEEPPQTKLTKKTKKEEKRDGLTADERTALELYQAIKSGKSRTSIVEAESKDDSEGEETASQPEDEAQAAEVDHVSEKRGINYQIAKNKGLTPHRKKEQRNPRVKHRSKFRKALISRKGQVRTTRTEVRRYDGEFSGIKASVVRSVKLKT